MGARLLRRLNAYEQVVRFSIASTQLIAAQASGGASPFCRCLPQPLVLQSVCSYSHHSMAWHGMAYLAS